MLDLKLIIVLSMPIITLCPLLYPNLSAVQNAFTDKHFVPSYG